MGEIKRFPISDQTEAAITQMRDTEGELQIGNVLRRTCQWAGENVCQQECLLAKDWQVHEQDTVAETEIAEALNSRHCSDLNNWRALQRLGLPPKNVLMVGVTGNNIGFADALDSYEGVRQNPFGWRELPGFNAFFARSGEELDGIGRRLADCADLNFELKDGDGKTVFGFAHGTRTNMRGRTAYEFEKDGERMSYSELVLREAVDHYGADIATFKIKLTAAISGPNFKRQFASREQMEEHMPGWYEDGFLMNATNPQWRPGDPVVETDEWWADSRDMIMRDVYQALRNVGGMDAIQQFSTASGIIDPAQTRGKHSSHQFAGLYGETRDLYITYRTP
jgi:hypothetical protein